MNIHQATELLNALAASESKVQIWFRIDGINEPQALTRDAAPLTAVDALQSVTACHNVAENCGKTVTFSISRFEN
jgi:hypothetical protein